MIEYLSHLADVCIRVEGDTLEDLFRNALGGMSGILTGKHKTAQPYTASREVTLSATDDTTLLIDFLSEVLSLCYIDKVIYCTIEDLRIRNSKLRAVVLGSPIVHLDEEIKAVTYHLADVQRNQSGHWESIIIFDT